MKIKEYIDGFKVEYEATGDADIEYKTITVNTFHSYFVDSCAKHGVTETCKEYIANNSEYKLEEIEFEEGRDSYNFTHDEYCEWGDCTEVETIQFSFGVKTKKLNTEQLEKIISSKKFYQKYQAIAKRREEIWEEMIDIQKVSYNLDEDC